MQFLADVVRSREEQTLRRRIHVQCRQDPKVDVRGTPHSRQLQVHTTTDSLQCEHDSRFIHQFGVRSEREPCCFRPGNLRRAIEAARRPRIMTRQGFANS